MKALADAGVRYGIGTDTGVPGRFQGYFEHLELEQMVEAGLTPMQVIKNTRTITDVYIAGNKVN